LIKPEAKPKVFYEIAGAGLDNVKRAAVIGGGDAAFDYALNLSGRSVPLMTVISQSEQIAG